MNYTSPIGGSVSGTGTFGGYGGILAALMSHYGQGMQQPQQQPEVDETELARMLGLIPGGQQRQQMPQPPRPGQPYPGGRPSGGPVMQVANQGIGLGR
jgi:hypothetical protein